MLLTASGDHWHINRPIYEFCSTETAKILNDDDDDMVAEY